MKKFLSTILAMTMMFSALGVQATCFADTKTDQANNNSIVNIEKKKEAQKTKTNNNFWNYASFALNGLLTGGAAIWGYFVGYPKYKQVNTLKEKLETANKNNQELKNKVTKLSEQIASLKKENQNCNNNLETEKQKIQNLNSDLGNCNADKQNLSYNLKSCNQTYSTLLGNFTGCKKEKDSLTAENQALNKEISSLRSNVTNLNSDLKSCNSGNQNLSYNLKSCQHDIDTIYNTIPNDEREKQPSNNNKIAFIKTFISTLLGNFTNCEKENQDLGSKLLNYNNEKESCQNQFNKCNTENSNLSRNNTLLINNLNSCENDYSNIYSQNMFFNIIRENLERDDSALHKYIDLYRTDNSKLYHNYTLLSKDLSSCENDYPKLLDKQLKYLESDIQNTKSKLNKCDKSLKNANNDKTYFKILFDLVKENIEKFICKSNGINKTSCNTLIEKLNSCKPTGLCKLTGWFCSDCVKEIYNISALAQTNSSDKTDAK